MQRDLNRSSENKKLNRQLLIILSIAVVAIFLLIAQFFFETFFLIGLLIVALLPNLKIKSYIKDWLPLLIWILLYEFMRGIADDLATRVHIAELINLERKIFGYIPTIELQKLWFSPGNPKWYDFTLYGFYLSYFFFTFLTPFWIWVQKRDMFKPFIYGFITILFLGAATYYLYPAMPPWLASQEGYLPNVHRILADFLLNYGWTQKKVSLTFNLIGSNPVAAMPSLHSAMPFFTALFLSFFYNKKLWITLTIPLGIWIAIVYFGEHYIIDVLAGMAYAMIGFMVSWITVKKQRSSSEVVTKQDNNIAM